MKSKKINEINKIIVVGNGTTWDRFKPMTEN